VAWFGLPTCAGPYTGLPFKLSFFEVGVAISAKHISSAPKGESSSTVELQIGGAAAPELVWWSRSPPKHARSGDQRSKLTACLIGGCCSYGCCSGKNRRRDNAVERGAGELCPSDRATPASSASYGGCWPAKARTASALLFRGSGSRGLRRSSTRRAAVTAVVRGGMANLHSLSPAAAPSSSDDDELPDDSPFSSPFGLTLGRLLSPSPSRLHYSLCRDGGAVHGALELGLMQSTGRGGKIPASGRGGGGEPQRDEEQAGGGEPRRRAPASTGHERG
jgi:hypothetical protein